MSTVDPRVAAVLDRTQQHEDSDDEDALIAELEEDEGSLAAFREQRLQQLHGELARAKAQRNSDYGTYTEIKDEKQLMDITTSAKLCVVHFMKPDFNRCRIMDQRLAVRLFYSLLLPYTKLTVLPGIGTQTLRYPLSQHQRRERPFPRRKAQNPGLALRSLLHRRCQQRQNRWL
jgi:hypothetical protein